MSEHDEQNKQNIICVCCGTKKPLDSYKKYVKENRYSNTCKCCHNKQDIIRKKNKRNKRLESIGLCELCNETKQQKHFAKLKKQYKRKICVSCYPHFLTQQKAEWCNKESKSNVNYRIKKSIAARLRTVLKKNTSTMNYIGCNIQYLREWFEYNFKDDMNWDNYGTYWSIDHVIPLNKYDLTNETEKMQCWNWSNLVPETIAYNSSKKCTIDMNQVNSTLIKLVNYKEEGSTTKWFSEDYTLNMEHVNDILRRVSF